MPRAQKTNKTRFKIPLDKWEEVYLLYSRGVGVYQIMDKLEKDYGIKAGHQSVYRVINTLKDEKKKHLIEIIDADTDDDFGRLKWLQGELEQVAIEVKQTDKRLFIQVADRLISIYTLKLTLRAKQAPVNIMQDHGREELLKELQATWIPQAPN